MPVAKRSSTAAISRMATWEKQKFSFVDYLRANAEHLYFEIVGGVKRLQENHKTGSKLLFWVSTTRKEQQIEQLNSILAS